MAMITFEQHNEIVKSLADKGYLPWEYVTPPKEIISDVTCPICGECIGVYTAATSYIIECPTKECFIETARGI